MKKFGQHTINSHLVSEDADFHELLSILNKTLNSNFGSGFALVIDSLGNLVGVVEDSDLRKHLSKSINPNLTLKEVMRRDFIFVSNNLSEEQIVNSVIQQMGQRGWNTSLPVRVIPITQNGKPVGIIDLKELESLISQKTDKNIVIGLGYVGLTLAVALAEAGRMVYGIDVDRSKLSKLNEGKSYILEPGIEKILSSRINQNFFVSTSIDNFAMNSGLRNIFYVCVNTPMNAKNQPDLSAIHECIAEIATVIKAGDTIVVRSTVPIGTGRKIIEKIETSRNWQVGIDFHYISAPERTVEGEALKEIRELPQLISGATEACLLLGLRLFQNISSSVTPLDQIECTELIKIMGNAYRDYIFGFSNFLTLICQDYNLDLNKLIEASNRGYPRSSVPLPSPGVGGPCLTKDPYFLSDENIFRFKSPVLAARKINEAIPKNSVKFIKSKLIDMQFLDCLALGITFKGIPETNDYRNSPSIEFIREIKPELKSIDYWDALVDKVEGDELKKFMSKYDKNKNYTFYALLTNNPKNFEFFCQINLEYLSENLVVYDPWRLVNPNLIKFPANIKQLKYFSLSHYEEIHN